MFDKQRKRIRDEIVNAIRKHVESRFGGDYDAAFDSYDRLGKNDGRISYEELRVLFEAAGAPLGVLWEDTVAATIKELDQVDIDGHISIEEFYRVFKSN